MPYIEEDIRKEFQALADITPITAGELNYCITRLCDHFLGGAVTYRSLNEVVGVLECAKQEFYRRVCVPYEDKKMSQNGDVYKWPNVIS